MKLHYVSCRQLLAFCAIPAFAASLTGPPPPTPVTAILMPDVRYSPMAIGEMGREAARILKRSSVSLRWRLGTTAQATSDVLVVVRLHGRCEMDGASAVTKAGPLGWSDEADGRMLPFGEVSCDDIRGTIQSAFLPTNHVPANVLLGRAMGRVLAHELYHIVADTAQHGKDGVAQPALSARELTSGQLELQPKDVDAIQYGLRLAGR
jgi:hypothetical protein